MSSGVPKSRVTLTYDTKQPEGRRKKRELPFRLLILGDVTGHERNKEAAKAAGSEAASPRPPIINRKLRTLNGRNIGEVTKGLKVQVKGVNLGQNRSVDLLIDGMGAFSPDHVLKKLTGQLAAEAKEAHEAAAKAKPGPKPDEQNDRDKTLLDIWGEEELKKLLAPDAQAEAVWKARKANDDFLKAYQNSRVLRTALKSLSAEPAERDAANRKAELEGLKQKLEAKLAAKSGGPRGAAQSQNQGSE